MNNENDINRFRARFDSADLEHAFRQDALSVYKTRTIISFIVVVLAAVFFILSDYTFLGYTQEFRNIFFVRILLISGMILLILICIRTKNEKFFDYTVLTGLQFLTGIVMAINFMKPVDFTYYVTLDVVIVFAFYVFLNTRFLFQVVSALILSAGDLFITFNFKELPSSAVVNGIIISYIIVNILGIYAAYRYHITGRRMFSALISQKEYNKRINETIDIVRKQKERLEELNLENIKRRDMFQTLTENTRDIVYSLNKKGCYTYIGPQVNRYGYTQDELLNTHYTVNIHPDDVKKVLDYCNQSSEKRNDTSTVQFRLYTKDRKIIWLEKNGTFNYNQSGEITAVTGIMRDITERMKVEKKLEEAYVIINRSPAVAFTWKNTENWPVEFVSENIFDLIGYTTEELISGKVKYADLIHPDDLKRVSDEVSLYSNAPNGTQFEHEPYRILTRDGTLKWVADWTFIVRNVNSEIVQYKGIVADITKEIEMRNEREKLIVDLTDAVNKIKTLKELIPICSSCKKIRNDEGYYEQVEEYISKHTDSKFSHGICPDCMKKLYADYCEKEVE